MAWARSESRTNGKSTSSFIHKQRPGARDLLPCRCGGDLRDYQGVVREHPKRVRTMVTGVAISFASFPKVGVRTTESSGGSPGSGFTSMSRAVSREGGAAVTASFTPRCASLRSGPGLRTLLCRRALQFSFGRPAPAIRTKAPPFWKRNGRSVPSGPLASIDGMDGGPRICNDFPQLPVVNLDASQRR